MQDLVDWLIKIEALARDFYSATAEYFEADESLKRFLKNTAEDESWHFRIMESAKSQLGHLSIPDAEFYVSDKVKDRIEAPFIENFNRLNRNELTQEQLLDCIAETEFSEWNKIFLYVVTILKEEFDEFNIAAARIQGHLGRVELFLKSSPQGIKKLNEITNLEKVFIENILVVEDSEFNLELMCSLLEEVGNVDGVSNGVQGLEIMKDKYYKLVISDIDMPEMDGITFYNEAVKKYPNLSNRFIITSGYIDAEREVFFKEHGIQFLPKPCDIEELLDIAVNVIHRA